MYSNSKNSRKYIHTSSQRTKELVHKNLFLSHSRKVLLLAHSTFRVSLFSHFILKYAGVDRLRVPSSSIISMTFTIFTYISAAEYVNPYTVCVFVNKRLLYIINFIATVDIHLDKYNSLIIKKHKMKVTV